MREFTITSTQKTEKLHCMMWEPDCEVKGVVQIAHGMAEHIARYDAFAEFLTKQGFVVVGHDHLGHGKTAKSEVDFGFFTRKDGHNIVIKDMYRVYRVTRKRYPTAPYILLGHSMGSYFARKFITIYGRELDGVILSGTGNQPYAVAMAGYVLAKLLVLTKGDHYRSSLINSMMFGAFAKSVKNRETDFDWLSREKENVSKYINDPACGFVFTTGGNRDFMKILLELGEKRGFDKIPRDLPILLCSGEEDPVGGKGKGVVAVYEEFGDMGMTNVTMQLYEEDRHEILNEVDKEMIYANILEWMEIII